MKKKESQKIFLTSLLLFLSVLFALPPGYYFSFAPFWQKNFGLGKARIEFSPASEPVIKKPFGGALTAKSWLIMDFRSGSLLGGKNLSVALPPASLTKIVTALVVLDSFTLDQVIVIKEEYPVGKTMGLVKNEKIKVIDLLTGLLVHSANDAAYSLATNYSGGKEAFVARMNSYVKERGLVRTHFINFDGEEDDNHFSTAYEIAQLARILLQNPVGREIVQIRKRTVFDVEGRLAHQLETTNQLLEMIPEAKGLKTGWTGRAGECFVGYFEVLPVLSNQVREIITVLMGSDDRFGETLKLLDWVKNNVVWEDYSETHSIEIAGTKPIKS